MAADEEVRKEKKKKKKDKERRNEDDSVMDISSQSVDEETKQEKRKKKKKQEKMDIESVAVKREPVEEDGVVESKGTWVKWEPPSYEVLVQNVSAIASPLASEKLTRRVLKCVKKAKEGKMLRRGVREVQKAVRRGEKGIAVFAGDTLPIDVYSHLPVLCEQKDVDYVYVPSKMGLGLSTGTKRPTCLVMIKPHDEYEDLYKKIQKEIKKLPIIVK